MTKSMKVFLSHILESIEYIEDYTLNISREEFYKDTCRQDAVIRRLEIIGEAAKGLTSEFTKMYPEIDWRGMAGMRDKLTHHYFGVNIERVWFVIKDDLPKLKKDLLVIIEKEGVLS